MATNLRKNTLVFVFDKESRPVQPTSLEIDWITQEQQTERLLPRVQQIKNNKQRHGRLQHQRIASLTTRQRSRRNIAVNWKQTSPPTILKVIVLLRIRGMAAIHLMRILLLVNCLRSPNSKDLQLPIHHQNSCSVPKLPDYGKFCVQM
ncbi:uncharacterized protein LOC126470508 [Schistocerca serialis cubense]|uniref:uncharacterized protein LOC126470508 n=1 Tax=Schistocerca serialis cubense TaxID=2023355 RepID=UPI00214E188C|nr:uncharacterized protein LOC126470508 [Schistocerca serialis cubense]